MNRLVRIALTLFISSTVLIFLVLQRLERAKSAQSLLHTRGGSSELAQSELQMAYLGMGLAGVMLTGGIVLIVMAIVRSRKQSSAAPPDPDHG